MLTIAIGADHAGYPLKEKIKDFLLLKNYRVLDFGTNSTESTHYPLFAREVCLSIQRGESQRGILICGTGIGMSIASNKFKGIRSALCFNEYMARMSRKHNDANVLCLGSRVIGEELAFSIVEAWLSADFEGGRHTQRVELIKQMESTP
ncbi:MAG: ribose 5-phosphate isomerase B [Aquificaceae bacterium]|nr:ribose 5-phosphate isomerase B [Aquificaceae bacterium]MCS7307370.1 ribose 5-phosphate isomerase B [Aquificaceae bacterium]MCX8076185.1 ribose 5-phosphate isomerase B [Aquificaceae bacterium]MDW8095705.1 ribose 5-phosphate isomerase B [Aquificaceae bacterium]MDW8433444.1 ribose 5-phosphate isomerase B [Aquificaceae bacterium]